MLKELAELAARFRTAVREQEEARRREAEEQRRQREAADKARHALLDVLATFGKEAGLEVARAGEGLTWRWQGREVAFRPPDDADGLEVSWEEGAPRSGRLYREAQLGGRWVLAVGQGTSEDRTPLVQRGLVRLLVDGMGMPEPAPPGERPAAPAEAPGEHATGVRRL